MKLDVTIHPDISSEVKDVVERWSDNKIIERIWRKDQTVWADLDVPEISNRLGWLDAPTGSRKLINEISELHNAAVTEGIRDLVLCGMGGSSLAPEVFASTLPLAEGSPRLTVMDSTHPDALRAVASSTDPATSWYLIASKSGGTIETISFYRFFWEIASQVLDEPEKHFIAVTDPGSGLELLATERGFRATLLADPEVGGRFSALTAFGLLPGGLIGADITALLSASDEAAKLCGPDNDLEENPGFMIGALMAVNALNGREIAHFTASDPISDIGVWIEQLIAESTGKLSKGIIPIDGGPLVGNPREVTLISIGSDPLYESNIELTTENPLDLAGIMFILEFATAVAGEILGVNPFDQPDVQSAKKLATMAMEEGLESNLPDPISCTGTRWIKEFLSSKIDTDPLYISIQAFVPQTEENSLALEEMRSALSEYSGTYVTVGFGPRFLHSTGQLHKGGPSGGIYLQLTGGTGDILEVPNVGYSFNELITAQAQGDRAALMNVGRTVISIDVGDDHSKGVNTMINELKISTSGED